MCARGINEGKNRQFKLGRKTHAADRFTVSFWMQHAKIARKTALRITNFFLGDHHKLYSIDLGQATYNSPVIAEKAIAIQFNKLFTHVADIINGSGPLRMTANGYSLPRREMGIDFLTGVLLRQLQI